MEYKKIENNSYTMHLINTDRFKMMSISLYFTKKFDKNDIVYGNFLTSNMVYTSKKYNTKNLMAIEGENLFDSKVAAGFGITGNTEHFCFSLEYLNPKYTSKEYLEKSIDFLYEVLLNPNIENDGFKEEYFNIIKKEAISSIESIKDNPNMYASIEYAKLMYKGTPTSYDSLPLAKELEKVTPQDLYKFYKTLFNGEYKIDVIIYGEYDSNIIDLINKKFNKLVSSKDKLQLTIKHKYNNKLNIKEDSLPFNQSKLYMGYRLIGLNYHELNHVMRVYNTILGTMNDSILFNIVREENSLCYSISSYYSKYNPALTIYSGINKKNYDKTVSLIKKCMELMKDKKTLERLFDSAKKTINTYLNNYYDDAIAQINKYYYNEFEFSEDIETYREEINKVTIDEIIDINSKISLSTIYLLKGDNE